LPVLWRDGYLSCILSNTLLLASIIYYFFITFRGYAGKRQAFLIDFVVLPFLKKQEYFLLPVAVIGVCLLLMTLFGYSQTNVFIAYFV
jgi:hypothetical protein